MIDQLLRYTVEMNPQKTALVCGRRRMSYEELDQLIGGFARSLQALGLEEAQRVTIMLPNCWEFVVALFAATRLRAIVQPLDPLLHEEALRKFLHDAAPKVVITDQGGLEKSRSIIAAADGDTACIVIGSHAGPALSFSALCDTASRYPGPAQAYEGRAIYLYTSGSSGMPKRICRTQRNLYCESANFVQTAQLTSSDHILCTIPLHHSYGLEMCLMAAIAAGTTLVILEAYSESGLPIKLPFSARCMGVIELIQREHIRVFPAVTQQFSALAQLPAEVSADLSGIRLCISSGNALPRAVYDNFLSRFSIPIRQSYGSSEAGTVTLNLDAETDLIPESVGAIVQNVCVSIVDDTGKDVAPGTGGHIWIKSPVLPEHGYDNVPEPQQHGFVDGHYHSGDLGFIDAQRRLFITGRNSRFIDTGGYKVDPQEIEEIIQALPSVREVVVVGVAAADVGEIVKAVIVPTRTGDEQEIKAYCRDRLASFKVPRIVEFRPALPRGPLGKILKGELVSEAERPEVLDLEDERSHVVPPEPVAVTSPSLYEEMMRTSSDGVESLVSHLQTQIAAMLDQAPSDICRHATFEQLGFDSLMAVEFCTWLASSLDVSCRITMVWNYPTPDALARVLLEHLKRIDSPQGSVAARDELPSLAWPQPQGDSRIAARLTEIESLSESEVYQSLLNTSTCLNRYGDHHERRQHAKAYSIL